MASLRRGYEFFDVTIEFQDENGDATTVDGEPQWTSSDPAVIEIAASENGVIIRSVGDIVGATATVTVLADTDPGDGVEHISVSDDVTIVAGRAVIGRINFGDQRPSTAATPEPTPTP